MSPNHLTKIAIVGASGNVGSHIVSALLGTGRHQVTAITRAGSTSKLPEGLAAIKSIDYDEPSNIAEALTGQEVLINTVSVAGMNVGEKLVDAAAEAGVEWIVPNEWGIDNTNTSLGEAMGLGPPALAMRKYIEDKGLKWTAISCSFWYEFSLAGSEARYGFDFAKKELTLIGDGKTKISTTTWPQVGRAVARLLSLPVNPQEVAEQGPFVSDWKNDAVVIESFAVSQRDMFDSVLRVTGQKESNWTVTHEDTKKRYERGQKMFAQCDMAGFATFMYTAGFFEGNPTFHGDKVVNEKLGLPKENLDEATKEAVRMGMAAAA